MLGLFLPFIGSLYGSAAAALVPLFVGLPVSFALTMFVATAKGYLPDTQALVLLVGFQSLFAVWSVFWSLAAVRKHNAAIIANAQEKSGI